MTRVIDIRPIANGNFRQACTCYDKVLPKDLKLIVDEKNDIVYCDHCGNIVTPMKALKLLCAKWDHIEYQEEMARNAMKRHYQIIRKYKPWKKAMRHIEQNIGQRGQYVPCCPHCEKPFRLESVSEFVDAKLVDNPRETLELVKGRVHAPLPPLTF